MKTNQQTVVSGHSTLVSDLTSGMVVALVALPLCLGVALASNAPLFAGILAGVVGGVLVGAISRSHTSVSGPAAGLTAVVAAQISLLGSFEAFLVAVFFAGILQVILGVIQAGSIADFVPASVIKGLLAAIGVILIFKQIPHLLGHDSDFEGDLSFFQPDHENTFSELGHLLPNIHPGAAVVGIASMVLLLVWERTRFLKRSPVPAPLAVVLVGTGIGLLLTRAGGRWAIDITHLVQVPVPETVRGFLDYLQFPDFSAITHPKIFIASVTIAAVASLETLLNLEAIDKLDPQRRVSPTNRELIAQGVGNMTAGLIGGLPVTSVIIRSSVNIDSGGKTKLATIVHGSLLLLCVVLLPTWLNKIPLSCLAAILIVTGFKLAKPKLFKRMWREGLNQFLPFIVTITAIVLTDLLIGILIGLAFSIVFILRSNLRRPLTKVVEQHIGGEVARIELANQVSFLNRAAISRALESVPRGGHVMIDARNTDYIDSDVHNLIWEYLEEVAPARGVRVSMVGLKDHYEQLADRVQYVDYTTRELQASQTPESVLTILQDGNERFRTGERLVRDLTRQLEATAETPHPLAIVLSGASSRTPVEMIFDVGLGDIYCARISGNLVSMGVLGSLEYACDVAGAKLIVVMGHNNSAVVRMAINAFLGQVDANPPHRLPHLEPVLAEIQQAIDPQWVRDWSELELEVQQARIDQVYRAHLLRTIEKIRQESTVVASLVQAGRVDLVAAMYDVRTGAVDFFK